MELPSSLVQIQSLLKEGGLRLPDVANYYLNRIHEHRGLNAFIEVYADEVREQAAAVQEKLDQGTGGRLAGMIIGLKDNICYAGHGVSAGSRILENYKSIYSSTVVERILAEDAIIIGRLNCDEFAMGGSNETSYYGPVKNFADPGRVPGGS